METSYLFEKLKNKFHIVDSLDKRDLCDQLAYFYYLLCSEDADEYYLEKLSVELRLANYNNFFKNYNYDSIVKRILVDKNDDSSLLLLMPINYKSKNDLKYFEKQSVKYLNSFKNEVFNLSSLIEENFTELKLITNKNYKKFNYKFVILCAAWLDENSIAKIQEEFNNWLNQIFYQEGFLKNLSISVLDFERFEDKFCGEIKEDKSVIVTLNNFSNFDSCKKNYLFFTNDKAEGVIFSLSARELKHMFSLYQKNLLDLNIRNYVKNKKVDEGLIKCINSKNPDFWFLNNGVTIICEDYQLLSEDKLKLINFKIINGGQTSYLISKHFNAEDSTDFYMQCKLLKVKKNSNFDANDFIQEVCIASNSQKPIKSSDLKANDPIMKQIFNILSNSGYFFQYKRGMDVPCGKIKISLEEYAQIIASFVLQKPGTARNNKSGLFIDSSVEDLYFQIFKSLDVNDSTISTYIVNILNIYFETKKAIINKISSLDNKIRNSNSAGQKQNYIKNINLLKNGNYFVLSGLGFLINYFDKNQEYFEEVYNENDWSQTLKNKLEENDKNPYLLSKILEDKNVLETCFGLLFRTLLTSYDEALNKNLNIITNETNFTKSDDYYIKFYLFQLLKKIDEEEIDLFSGLKNKN